MIDEENERRFFKKANDELCLFIVKGIVLVWLIALLSCLMGCGGGGDDEQINTTQPVHCTGGKCS